MKLATARNPTNIENDNGEFANGNAAGGMQFNTLLRSTSDELASMNFGDYIIKKWNGVAAY